MELIGIMITSKHAQNGIKIYPLKAFKLLYHHTSLLDYVIVKLDVSFDSFVAKNNFDEISKPHY